MKKYTTKELKEILRLNKLGVCAYLSDADLRGADLSYANLSYADLRCADLSYADLRCADLSYADLRYANLRGADLRNAKLRDAIGNMSEVKSLQLDTYNICYTCDMLTIGCQSHSIEKWKLFSDEEILKMDGKKALEFWGKYKKIIFDIIELSPAKLTEER